MMLRELMVSIDRQLIYLSQITLTDYQCQVLSLTDRIHLSDGFAKCTEKNAKYTEKGR